MGEHFPYDSISKMVPWDFWARPSSLDVEPADQLFVSMPPDAIPPESRARIHKAGCKAACELRDAEVGIPSGKPS